ncbi:Phospholipase D family member 3 [Fasciola gigantica]|uniref:Phospholipase D family member 3 n=1 Tax=Fasciola gigantica TaxID=46835 RepID=A0A504Z5U9_FASGI|nr:Phospholipase D family member 3 [Fasciola gigantica]
MYSTSSANPVGDINPFNGVSTAEGYVHLLGFRVSIEFFLPVKMFCRRTFLVGLLVVIADQIQVNKAIRSRKHWRDVSQYDSLNCNVQLVESIPENLTYPVGTLQYMSTIDAWKWLLGEATQNLYLAEFYWTMNAEDEFNFSATIPGREIFKQLTEKSRQIKVKISQNGPPSKNAELASLAEAGAEIFWIDVPKLLGDGIIHTKLWSVDQKHAYLGSANTDWRALTEVKELGILFSNCPDLVIDLDKIHRAYRLVSKRIPEKWPDEMSTSYNKDSPMRIKLNGVCSVAYFSSSPTAFNPPGRTYDLDAILSVINKAERFIYISVMNYIPEIVKYDKKKKNTFWPAIDDALRSAAISRGVEVRLLVSLWPSTPKSMSKYLTSLHSLNGIQHSRIRVRYFVVPSFTAEQKKIPYARVKHDKYMVTDKNGYIGTSNWSGDYFIHTAGVGFVFEHTEKAHLNGTQTLREQLQTVFERDWNSQYTEELFVHTPWN